MKEGTYMSNPNYVINILNLKDNNIIFKNIIFYYFLPLTNLKTLPSRSDFVKALSYKFLIPKY